MPINYKDYPADWKQIRACILDRDKHRCKFCLVPNGTIQPSGKKFIRIVLTIAHLDHDRTNNDSKNLAALCQACHRKHK